MLMANYQKNILAFVVGIIVILFMLFIWPNTVFPQDGCPSVPAGFLSPAELVSDAWSVVEIKQDTTFGMHWYFLRIKIPMDGRTHALAVMIPGTSWPVMYNYLENGELIFLRFSSQRGEYIIDDNVDSEDYNVVAGYYKQFLGVNVQPKQGV